jgi:hypothetical protein
VRRGRAITAEQEAVLEHWLRQTVAADAVQDPPSGVYEDQRHG